MLFFISFSLLSLFLLSSSSSVLSFLLFPSLLPFSLLLPLSPPLSYQAPEADYLDAAVVSVLQIHLTQPRGDILVRMYM